MGLEIERKFLVTGTSYKIDAKAKLFIRQGFLNDDPLRAVRVRITDEKASITIKGRSRGTVRAEFEYPVPIDDAELMLNEICMVPLIMKNRYIVKYLDTTWEVDEFLGENKGLVIAEVELDSEDAPLALPEWVGEEVTDDPRFYNVNLVTHPYTTWNSVE